MTKKILVTGSSGTIGTRLSEILLQKGYSVVGCDWKENKWNKQIDNLTVRIDLRDKEKVLSELPKDIDMVIHLAANARVYNLVKEPGMARDNFETLFNILEFARLNGIKNSCSPLQEKFMVIVKR
jgi:nucleoside-diphosphate-sugar epimerase